jgi:hypothetical protein
VFTTIELSLPIPATNKRASRTFGGHRSILLSLNIFRLKKEFRHDFIFLRLIDIYQVTVTARFRFIGFGLNGCWRLHNSFLRLQFNYSRRPFFRLWFILINFFFIIFVIRRSLLSENFFCRYNTDWSFFGFGKLFWLRIFLNFDFYLGRELRLFFLFRNRLLDLWLHNDLFRKLGFTF